LLITCFEIGSDRLSDLLENMLQLFLGTISCFTIDRFAFAAVKGDECSPKELQGLAEDGTFSADAFQRLCIVVAKISNRFKIWGELGQQPQQLQMALACVCKFSTGANLV